MDVEFVLDLSVVLVAIATVALMLLLMLLFLIFRKDPVMRVNNVPMLMLMSLGAAMHITAEIVTNRHLGILSRVERSSCALWGYWIPYVGAGIFFVGLYLRLIIYRSAFSRDLNYSGARRLRRYRVPIAFFTMVPILFICAVASLRDGGAHVDKKEGECTSGFGFKVAVAAWMLLCILALVTSVLVFRKEFVKDIVGETRKQIFVALMGVVVLAAVTFEVVFAQDGLKNAANRVVATLSIVILYLWALGVLGMRPLWKATRKTREYEEVLMHDLSGVYQSLTSVSDLVRNATDAEYESMRILFGDFLIYCQDAVHPPFHVNRKQQIQPQQLSVFYSQMDAWVSHRMLALGMSETDPEFESMPPRVSSDIMRTAQEIVSHYFSNPAVYGFIQLHVPDDVRHPTITKHMTKHDPIDTFEDAMWWALRTLDRHLGEEYLAKIGQRDIYVSQDGRSAGVRLLIHAACKREAQKRYGTAGLVELDDVSVSVSTTADSRVDDDDDADSHMELSIVSTARESRSVSTDSTNSE